jgi:hypothetical protein
MSAISEPIEIWIKTTESCDPRVPPSSSDRPADRMTRASQRVVIDGRPIVFSSALCGQMYEFREFRGDDQSGFTAPTMVEPCQRVARASHHVSCD